MFTSSKQQLSIKYSYHNAVQTVSHYCHISNSPLFDHPYDILLGTQIMKPTLYKFFAPPFDLSP
jgi:hypothetical protein